MGAPYSARRGGVGVDGGGAARGWQRGGETGGSQQRGERKGERQVVRGVEIDDRRKQPARGDREQRASSDAEREQRRRAREHRADDAAARGAKRHADTDVACAQLDFVLQRTVEADEREQEGQAGEGAEEPGLEALEGERVVEDLVHGLGCAEGDGGVDLVHGVAQRGGERGGGEG